MQKQAHGHINQSRKAPLSGSGAGVSVADTPKCSTIKARCPICGVLSANVLVNSEVPPAVMRSYVRFIGRLHYNTYHRGDGPQVPLKGIVARGRARRELTLSPAVRPPRTVL